MVSKAVLRGSHLFGAAPDPDIRGPGAVCGKMGIGSDSRQNERLQLRLQKLKFVFLSSEKVNY